MKPYWSREPAELLMELNSGSSGLSLSTAIELLRRNGENTIASQNGSGTLSLLHRQFANPLVLILVFGAGVSLIVNEWTEAATILLIVVGSTLLGFYQESKASRAIERLRQTLALQVTVIRDGEQQSIDAKKIVSGDVILLSAGNLIPADGIVLESNEFLVSQAALTGESFPVEKRTGAVAETATLPERTNTVFMGTSVRSGTARVLIVQTGQQTEFGRIARRLTDVEEETDFSRGIREFGYLLTRIMFFIVMFVVVVNLLLHRPPLESLLFAVALAVGLTPELLPAIVSVTLSVGARRMAVSGVIVRRVEAIENLGSMDILCTDKTGTLTTGIVELESAVDPSGCRSDNVMRLATINARLETGIANPLDEAIVAAASTRNIEIHAIKKIDEVPYDFVRKRLTIVVAENDFSSSHVMITKGAFDNVLECCDRIATQAGPQRITESDRQRLQAYYKAKGSAGYRVLGVATKEVSGQPGYCRSDESAMLFEGMLLFLDPLKEGIAETIREFERLGIAIKIITGDNRHVAGHVGEAVGLSTSRILTGDKLAETRTEALWNLAEQTDIFAEVDPQQKERIVQALQHRGHSVGYLGDGINDAPSLHTADVGISVDQAVDVARESADIVLLERNLSVLLDGIVCGRRTFANTLKYISITTSANFGNMISMAVATLFLPYLPLLARQILLNNFLSDFPSIALSTDRVDSESTQSAGCWNIKRIRSFMILFGLISTVFDLLLFFILLVLFQTTEALFQSTWFVVSLLTELGVVFILRTHLPVGRSWQSRPGRWLVISSGFVAALAIALPYSGPIARLFNLVPIPGSLFASGLIVLAIYLCTTEIVKRWFFRD